MIKKKINKIVAGERDGEFLLTIGLGDKESYGYSNIPPNTFGDIQPTIPNIIHATNGEVFDGVNELYFYSVDPRLIIHLNKNEPSLSDCKLYLHIKLLNPDGSGEYRLHSCSFYFNKGEYSTQSEDYIDYFGDWINVEGQTIPIYLGSSPTPPNWL